jgi:type I restriction enzyme, S subunit
VNSTEIRSIVDKVKTAVPGRDGSNTFLYVDISSIDRNLKTIMPIEKMSVEDAPSRARQLINENDVLVSTVRPNLNAIAKVPRYLHNSIASTGFCVLRPDRDTSSSYLYHFCRSQTFIEFLLSRATGAGYPAVTDGDVFDAQIPFPPLTQQKKVAHRLEQADRLRRLRAYALEVSDRYLQGVFLEMFGDPETNQKGWNVFTLDDLNASFKYGTSEKSNDDVTGTPILRIPNVLNRSIDIDDMKYTHLSEKELGRLKLSQGDILFVRTNGNPEYVGRCTVFDLPEKYAFASYLIRARIDQKVVNPWYLESYLQQESGRKKMRPYIRTTAGQSNISIEGLGQIPVPLPPLSLQSHFASIVQKHERLRTMQVEALRQAELLYSTLLEQAFGDASGAIP